jgi:hypothetical protein
MMAVGLSVQWYGVAGTQLAGNGPTDSQTSAEAMDNRTLAQVMQSLRGTVDWNSAVYAGMVFNERNKTDLEALIDNYSSAGDWSNVLKWTAISRKLGIERESAIKAALDGLPMVGPLPWTIKYSGVDYFGVEYKFALLGYQYAEKYNYRLDKWNKTNAYVFLKTAVNNEGHPVLFINGNGGTYTISYGPRYYDEAASTIQCFLVFYEMGIADGLDQALLWWNWTNNNLWHQDTHYKYGLSWSDYECEAGFFAKIIANLEYYELDLGNWSRVSADLQNRFLIDNWNSKQWFSGSEGNTTHVVVHHYPSNAQRRLQNTIGAWTAMFSFYDDFKNTSQNSMQTMLEGDVATNPAWKLVMDPFAMLYDNSTSEFRWTSGDSVSDEATAYALTLMFLMGIVPKTTAPAFPIEEYCYEYFYDIDPELYSINLDNNTVRLSIDKGGELEFIYGTSPTFHNFSESGVYNIVFSGDWNSVVTVSKYQDLPQNRKFGRQKHDIAIVNITTSPQSPLMNETVTTQVTVFNKGDFTETFNLVLESMHLVGSLIGNQTITLAPRESETLSFAWTPPLPGKYEIIAYTSIIPYEADMTDNTKTDYLYVRYLHYGSWGLFAVAY